MHRSWMIGRTCSLQMLQGSFFLPVLRANAEAARSCGWEADPTHEGSLDALVLTET